MHFIHTYDSKISYVLYVLIELWLYVCIQKSADNYLSALPNCVLSYHWPRVDLDNLLCVRMMDKPACRWSGGFQIDRVDSFHINMRLYSVLNHF